MDIYSSFSKIIVILHVVWHDILAERCQYVLQNKQGIIKSPNHPQLYPNNIVCTWRIEAQEGYNIMLKVTSFRLEGTSPECKHDALMVYDGRNESAASFQSPYCDREIPSSFKSTSNVLFLKFKTDSLGRFSGFKIEYKAEQNCNRTINADNGTIQSPRYPEEYYSNADCYWTIITSVGTNIVIKFQDFRLEGRHSGIEQCYDYLKFYEILPGKKTKQLGIYCGRRIPFDIKSKSNKMRIHFFSDGTVTKKGFYITFSAQSSKIQATISTQHITAKIHKSGVCSRSQFKCNNDVCISNEKRCNQHKDCDDQSDEIHCAGSCLIDNGGCEQKCNSHPLWKEFCSCEAGYELTDDKKTCQDVNECAESNGGCGDLCSNFIGGYKCECSGTGYQIGADGKTCQDIDECLARPCTHACENTLGSYRCTCNHGYRATSLGTCVDEDECAIGVPSCFDCINTIGSYRCNCYNGFVAVDNDTKCEDIDECTDHSHQCSHYCQNTIGSYKCRCKEGFAKIENRCIDINECEIHGSKCEHFCVNSPGSYKCDCRPGFILANQTNCIDINECRARISCQYGCTMVNSSFTCTCPTGYILSSNERDCHRQVNLYDCGVVQTFIAPKKYIFSEAAKNSWPWKAKLETIFSNRFKMPIVGCMATVVSKLHLLTTAHCVHLGEDKITPSQLHVVLSDSRDENSTFRAKEIIIHPDYEKRNLKWDADVALIKLAKPIETGPSLQPICMQGKDALKSGDDAVLISWGRLDEKRFSSTLRQINVTVQNSTNCAWLQNVNRDMSKMSCVGDFSASDKPCLADSGTPLMIPRGAKWFLAGMMVYGAGYPKRIGCSHEFKSNAFYDLSYFHQWINRYISSSP